MSPWGAALDAAQGGSAASISVRRSVVAKTAASGGRAKLMAEARWLQWVTTQRERPELHARFPAVVSPPTMANPTLVVRRLGGTCARTAVLTGAGPDVTALVEQAVSFAFDDLSGLGSRRGDTSTGLWCAAHLMKGLDALRRQHPELAPVRHARRLLVGGVTLPNPLAQAAVDVREALARGVPRRVCVIHGDLHLGNVLIDLQGGCFALVDPRGGWDGDPCFDPAYDVAKLLHEPHYVQARSGAAPCRLSARGEDVVVDAATVDALSQVRVGSIAGESWTRLADVSLSLAERACGHLSETDPLVAARATLITGVLFVAMLRMPHTRTYQPANLLGHGLAWLAGGMHALRHDYGPARCRALWAGLLATSPPDDWSGPLVSRALEVP